MKEQLNLFEEVIVNPFSGEAVVITEEDRAKFELESEEMKKQHSRTVIAEAMKSIMRDLGNDCKSTKRYGYSKNDLIYALRKFKMILKSELLCGHSDLEEANTYADMMEPLWFYSEDHNPYETTLEDEFNANY